MKSAGKSPRSRNASTTLPIFFGDLAGRLEQILVVKERIGLLHVVLLDLAGIHLHLDGGFAVLRIVEPGDALVVGAEKSLQHVGVRLRPGTVDRHAGERHVGQNVEGEAEIGIAGRLGEEIERHGEQRGVDRAGFQRREPRAGGAGEYQIIVAGFQSVRRQHPLGEDARDVLGAADDDGLALEILDCLDFGLGEKRIGRRLDDDADQTRPARLCRWRGSDRPCRRSARCCTSRRQAAGSPRRSTAQRRDRS